MHTQTLTKKYAWQKLGQWFGIHKKYGPDKKNISLRGVLKGVEITEEDIEAAKRSLFKTM